MSVPPDPMIPRLARVVNRWREGPQTWTIEIEDSAADGAPFAPGQFNMLYVLGVGEIPISFSGDPASGPELRHTVRAVGAVSTALAQLRPGDTIGLRGPFGTGWPLAAAAGCDVIVVAGGLGLAPLRPAIYRLLAERDRYGRINILYGTRSPDDILFLAELTKWRRDLDIGVEVTVDHAAGDWRGQVGVVTSLIPRAAFAPTDSIAMVCGPAIMMRFTAAALSQAGVRDEAIYLSMERNMKCAVGVCGHCQLGATFVCKDGPVLRYDRIRDILRLKEI
ncbi:MAG: FAD/NAD(P)-binding protein [Hyphomicrobiales bacterium]|nr:FAD/NAD(P)-binding protein [Hyphomicrobiales bacterium]